MVVYYYYWLIVYNYCIYFIDLNYYNIIYYMEIGLVILIY